MSEAKDADVDRLTREEIENIRRNGVHAIRFSERTDKVIELCDLALSALSQDAVRDAVLDKTIAICREMGAFGVAQRIEALKREPNAAARVSAIDGGQVDAFNTEPAPAAMELWAWWRMTTTGAVAFVGKEPPDKLNIWSPLYRRSPPGASDE